MSVRSNACQPAALAKTSSVAHQLVAKIKIFGFMHLLYPAHRYGKFGSTRGTMAAPPSGPLAGSCTQRPDDGYATHRGLHPADARSRVSTKSPVVMCSHVADTKPLPPGHAGVGKESDDAAGSSTPLDRSERRLVGKHDILASSCPPVTGAVCSWEHPQASSMADTAVLRILCNTPCPSVVHFG
jgi:hypothetical protein